MKSKSSVPLLAVLYTSAFIAGFNENLMNMALISIMNEYAIDSVTAQWLVTGFMIVSTIGVACMAFFYRRFNLRPLFFSAAILTLAGSVMGLFAMNFTFLMVARLIQAAGSGIFIPLMMNTILAIIPKNKLGSFMSIGGCMITFGPALAPVVCGALVTAAGWHSVFYVPTISMVAIIIAGAFLIRNLETHEAHLDIPSVVLASVFLFTLSFGLAELMVYPFYAGIALVTALVSAIIFALRQIHCAYPLIDLTPMRIATFWPTIIMVIIAMMTTFSLSVLLPLYLEGALGLSAFIAGIIILVPVLGNAGATLLGGRFMDKYGEWPLLPLGFAAVVAGLIALAMTSQTMNLPATFAGALVAYLGIGLVFSPSQTAGLRTLPPQLNPFGVALTTTFLQIAACIGPSLYIGIMSSAEVGAIAAGSSPETGAAAGFAQAIWVATAISAIGFITATIYSIAAKRRTQQANPRTRSKRTPRPALLGSIMEPEPYTIRADAPMQEAMNALVSRKVGGMPVVDARGRGVGYLSDGDIMRYLADRHSPVTGAYALIEIANNQSIDERLRELMALPVGQIATEGLVSVNAQDSLKEACALLSQHKLKKVPVVENDTIIGTLNRSDILRYAMETYLDAASSPVPQQASSAKNAS